MIANWLAVPFVLGALFFLYLAWVVDGDYAPWIVPFVLISALIYIFSPQINWWWHARRPPKLDPELEKMLARFCGFYQRLPEAEKQRFRERLMLFQMGTDWEPLAFPEDNLPADVQLALSAQAVSLTFGREQFLFEKFEKVIVWPRPFPTPEYPFDHASELYEADGCLLFSAEQVLKAFVEPARWYNVGLHEYARAFVLSYPSEGWPALAESDVWEKLEAASGMSRAHLEAVIGLAGVEALPVAIHHFFTFPERFARAFPAENQLFSKIFHP
jgi:Mlc titration factor MtfA (ptsG expression regulator)